MSLTNLATLLPVQRQHSLRSTLKISNQEPTNALIFYNETIPMIGKCADEINAILHILVLSPAAKPQREQCIKQGLQSMDLFSLSITTHFFHVKGLELL